jgi:hypothetical protein
MFARLRDQASAFVVSLTAAKATEHGFVTRMLTESQIIGTWRYGDPFTITENNRVQ